MPARLRDDQKVRVTGQVEITCPHCGEKVLKWLARVNEAKRRGTKIFCSKTCAWQFPAILPEEKRAGRRAYSAVYKNQPGVKARNKKASQIRHAKNRYGEFWEAQILILQIKEKVAHTQEN